MVFEGLSDDEGGLDVDDEDGLDLGEDPADDES